MQWVQRGGERDFIGPFGGIPPHAPEKPKRRARPSLDSLKAEAARALGPSREVVRSECPAQGHSSGPTLLAELAGLPCVALVHCIGTRSQAGGLIASAKRPGPSAIAPDPVAVARRSRRLL